MVFWDGTRWTDEPGSISRRRSTSNRTLRPSLATGRVLVLLPVLLTVGALGVSAGSSSRPDPIAAIAPPDTSASTVPSATLLSDPTPTLREAVVAETRTRRVASAQAR